MASRRKEMRKFKKHFLEFWEKLVATACANGVIYDGYLADTLIAWQTAISRYSLYVCLLSFNIARALFVRA